MGKYTGFMEYNRKTPAYRDELERLNDWNEMYQEFPESDLKEQGARCMECGVPYCHMGMVINGMPSGCPITNLIPEWNDLVYRGLWEEAFKRLDRTNNFPEFTGRVCPAPCEGACTCGLNGDSVTIKNIELNIIEKAFENGWAKPTTPKIKTGKTVAVVGSGPAGLACAEQLNKAGHTVTVFERADRPGGLLMYGIPNMKLGKNEIVMRRIKLMEQSGINFVTKTEIGKDIPAKKLMNDFDAVVLATGATKGRDLPLEGRELNGVHFAMDFLKANTKSLLDSKLADNAFISAKDKDVIVIGGGDTGTDCVATSLRHGCKSVAQLEIMPQPPEKRAENNPWPEWPKTLKVDYGQHEAIAVNGKDPRNYLISTKKFVGENGNLKEIHTINIEWIKDENGRFQLKEIAGTEKVWPAQLVLLAMGFTGSEDTIASEIGVSLDGATNIKSDFGSFKTNVDKVFSAGDARRGQSLVVHAINEGRQCAKAVDAYLMGESFLP